MINYKCPHCEIEIDSKVVGRPLNCLSCGNGINLKIDSNYLFKSISVVGSVLILMSSIGKKIIPSEIVGTLVMIVLIGIMFWLDHSQKKFILLKADKAFPEHLVKSKAKVKLWIRGIILIIVLALIALGQLGFLPEA